MDFERSDWQTRKMVITPLNSTPGKTYGLIKTHKRDSPVRFSTSSCNTVTKNLSTCAEQVFMSYQKIYLVQLRIATTCFTEVIMLIVQMYLLLGTCLLVLIIRLV